MWSRKPSTLDVSYLNLRLGIGVLGVALPFILRIGSAIFPPDPYSMSAYYYSAERNILVASLCVLGALLLTYQGYDKLDSRITNVCGAATIGVALFPTAPTNPSTSAKAVGYVHLTCAALLFITLAVIALWLFRLTEPHRERTPEKRKRDRVYLICGVVIALCVVLVPVESLVIGAPIAKYHPLFWLEAVAIVAFGVAWLVKGETLFKDAAAPDQAVSVEATPTQAVPEVSPTRGLADSRPGQTELLW